MIIITITIAMTMAMTTLTITTTVAVVVPIIMTMKIDGSNGYFFLEQHIKRHKKNSKLLDFGNFSVIFFFVLLEHTMVTLQL